MGARHLKPPLKTRSALWNWLVGAVLVSLTSFASCRSALSISFFVFVSLLLSQGGPSLLPSRRRAGTERASHRSHTATAARTGAVTGAAVAEAAATGAAAAATKAVRGRAGLRAATAMAMAPAVPGTRAATSPSRWTLPATGRWTSRWVQVQVQHLGGYYPLSGNIAK